jgi:hypothetical protein
MGPLPHRLRRSAVYTLAQKAVVLRSAKEEIVASSSNRSQPPARGASVERNSLALVSFWLSLVFPAVLLLNLASIGIVVFPMLLLPRVLSDVVAIVATLALIAALVTGHMALRRASRYPSPRARRWLATSALVLGYLSLAVALGVVGLFIWLATHPIRMHLVF